MDRELIIRLAREAGAVFPADGSWHKFEVEGSLEHFANLVAAHEREECAKILDGAPRLVPSLQFPGGHCFVCGLNSEKIAAAIRSRA